MSDDHESERKKQVSDNIRTMGKLSSVSKDLAHYLRDLNNVNGWLEDERRFLSPQFDILRDLNLASGTYSQVLRELDRGWRDDAFLAQSMAEQVEAARKLAGLDGMQSALASIQSDYANRLLDMQRGIDQAFRLPYVGELDKLAEQYQRGSVAQWLTMSQLQPDVERLLDSIQQPFLQTAKELRSVSAIAELQGIGQIIAGGDAFSLEFADALRIDLGDWRDEVTWPEQLDRSTQVRVDLYLRQGLDPDLAAFPEGAFEKVLGLAALDAAQVEDDDTEATEPRELVLVADGDPMTRMGHAYQSLFAFERRMRKFIDACMRRAFGPTWPQTRLPNGLYDKWRTKHQKAISQGVAQDDLIAYADFTDYEPVICKRDNWEHVFQPVFIRPEFVRESMQRLYPVRLAIMHARFITQEDQLFLYVEIARVSKALDLR